jgi:DNA-binding IclR family transcriptional regulator
VLRALARLTEGEGRTAEIVEITQQTRLGPQEIQRALETLARHDVVTQANVGWKFTVELMRRWVAQKNDPI